MVQRVSWLREVFRLYLRYLIVGVAFVPAGLVYALLARSGWDHWLVAAGLLAAGFFTAWAFWQLLDRPTVHSRVQVFQERIQIAAGSELIQVGQQMTPSVEVECLNLIVTYRELPQIRMIRDEVTAGTAAVLVFAA